MRHYPKYLCLFLIIRLFAACEKTVPTIAVNDLSVWNEAPNNAFTDLIKFDNSYYCTFREGAKHDSYDGRIRVIKSEDGKTWRSFALLSLANKDLRDPHFFIDNNNTLSIGINGRNNNNIRENMIFKLKSGSFAVSEKVSVDNDYWFWTFTRNKQSLYSIGYNIKQSCFSSLNSTKPKISLFSNKDDDCTDFENFSTTNFTPVEFSCPCESSLVFVNDSTVVAVVRDEHTPGSSHIGYSIKPFQTWQWKNIPFFVRGPKLAMLPDGRIFIAAASMGNYNKTYYAILNPSNFSVEKIYALPSDGDTGYPGVIIEGNTALISYYSSHEGNSRVYIGRITY